MPVPLHLETILLEELIFAKKQHELAKIEFWHAAAEVSSRDMEQRTEEAAQHKAETLAAMCTALHRLNAFLIDATIPEDLKEKEIAKGQSA